MNTRPLPMLHGQDAHDSFHRAMQKISRDSTQPQGKKTLGTRFSATETPREPTEVPTFVREYDQARKADSGIAIVVILVATISAMLLVAWIYGR